MLSYNKNCGKFILKSASILLFFIGFLNSPLFAAEKPLILSSIRPLSLIVEEIAGDWVESVTLLSAADSPHHLSLKVSQIKALRSASLVIWIGSEFEPYLQKPLRNSSELAVSELPGIFHLNSSHSHENQHIWIHPGNLLVFTEAIAAELETRLPEAASEIKTKSARLVASLRAADVEAAALTASNKSFITFHDGLGYYVSAYKLNHLANVVEGNAYSPSVSHLSLLKQQVKAANCLVADVQEYEIAKRYSVTLGLPLVTVDLLAAKNQSNDLIAWYKDINKALEPCLN